MYHPAIYFPTKEKGECEVSRGDLDHRKRRGTLEKTGPANMALPGLGPQGVIDRTEVSTNYIPTCYCIRRYLILVGLMTEMGGT